MSQIGKRDFTILCVILILGIALRLYNLDQYSIFFDEKSTLVVSQGLVLDGSNQKEIFLAKTFTPSQFWSKKTLADYYEAMSRSDIGNSPFYYLLLHFWLELLGISDFSMRLLSVMFSTLIIAMIYVFGRRFFSSKSGLIAAALVAVEPFFISYGQQARNYSLTFFLCLLATYLFLQIIESKSTGRRSTLLHIWYALTACFALLSHFLTISVLLAHAIYALIYLRSWSRWLKMAAAGIVAVSGLAWWLIFAGGQSTLANLADQGTFYRSVAESGNQTFGDVLPATPRNVFVKSLPTLSDEIIFTNGLTEALQGKKNVILAVLIGLTLTFWYRTKFRKTLPAWLDYSIPLVLILAGLAYYNNHKLQFTILSVSIFTLSFLYDIHRQSSQNQRRRLWFLYVMIIVPISFIVIMSFKNGHTFALTQHRYSGSSFPYVILLVSLLLQNIFSLPTVYRSIILIFISIQFYFVAWRLNEYYEDKSPKYGYFATPRPSNPFHLAAKRIMVQYQPGDTVIYPAKPNIILRQYDKNFSNFRMRDAQLTNLYLPKDAEYVQRVDTTEPDKIFIQRKKELIEILNLKGLRAGDD